MGRSWDRRRAFWFMNAIRVVTVPSNVKTVSCKMVSKLSWKFTRPGIRCIQRLPTWSFEEGKAVA